jgi:hypothetical protein
MAPGRFFGYCTVHGMENALLEPAHLTDVSCRLCGGQTNLAFRKLVIAKHDVAFFRCQVCESLQTEKPYWLAEAYSQDFLDTGAAQRVLHCVALTHSVMRLLGYRTALDFGGGSGLLCRLLRDAGLDAFWYDQYAAPGYAAGFSGSPGDFHDLITAFEVIEHFPDPRADLGQLFSGKPRALLFMTEMFTGQDEEWSYLAPEEGQHVFFYSPEALRRIGDRFGYHLLICRGFILFLRDAPTAFQRWVLQTLLRHRVLKWIKLRLLAGPGLGANRDYDVLTARIAQKS